MNANPDVIVRMHIVPLNGGPLDGSVHMLRVPPNEQERDQPELRVDAGMRQRTRGLPKVRDDRIEVYRLVCRRGTWRYVYQETVR